MTMTDIQNIEAENERLRAENERLRAENAALHVDLQWHRDSCAILFDQISRHCATVRCLRCTIDAPHGAACEAEQRAEIAEAHLKGDSRGIASAAFGVGQIERAGD